MKKLVIAAAVLGAFAGSAQAQSSVTLFGVVDTNITHISAGSNGGRTFMDNSGINSSRLGFRGLEDLGGGLHAGFWLEAGINTDDGTGAASNKFNQSPGAASVTNATPVAGGQGLTFNRRSTVSLLGDSWGEVRLGRDYSPTFWNLANLDPFGYNGVAEINNLGLAGQSSYNSVRVSNSASYLTPTNLGGFFLQATHAFGENSDHAVNADGADTSDDGTYNGVNLGYANGPIYFGVSTAKTQYASTPETGNLTVTNIGGSYDFGIVKPDLLYQDSKVATIAGDAKFKFWNAGIVIPVGVGQIRASYNYVKEDGLVSAKADQIGIGYVYFLSKRTALYIQASHMTNKGDIAATVGYTPAPVPGQNQSGEQIGLRHTF